MAVWGLSRYVRLPFLPLHSHAAIPTHTPLFFGFEKGQVSQLQSGNLPNVLREVFLPDALNNDLSFYESTFGGFQFISPEEKTFVTVNPTQRSGIDLLFILPETKDFDIVKWVKQNGEINSRSSVFEGQEVFNVGKGNSSFAFTKFRNLTLLARHAYLVENAIRQIQTPTTSVCQNEGFRNLDDSSLAINNDSHKYEIYLNVNQLGAEFAPLLEPSQLNLIKQLGQLGDFGLFTFHGDEGQSNFNASFAVNANSNLVSACGEGPKLASANVLPYLPTDLTAFISLNQKGFSPENGTASWNEFISPWMRGSVTFSLGEKLGAEPAEKFLLFQAKDAKIAEAKLEKWHQSNSEEKPAEVQMFKVFSVDGESLSKWFGSSDFAKKSFATVLGDYVLFSNSKAGIERWLVNYVAGQTFSKSTAYLTSISGFPSESHVHFYFESVATWQMVSQFLTERRGNFFRHNPFTFNHLVGTGNWDGNSLDCEFASFSKQQEANLPAGILWQTPLSGKAKGRPLITENPRSREKEIMVKDGRDNIYLISNNGRIKWQRSFDSPILSEITSIDLHGEGDRQFVLNTTEAIYVIDDDGSDMTSYPLQLQVPATNGVTVIDFFQSNDYHFFVACENGNAYGFDERGSPVEGWRPKTGLGYVQMPLLHFQAMGMDFLALLNSMGELQVFQKNGKYRFPKVNLENGSLQSIDYQTHSKSSRIVSCDDEGWAYVINFKGDRFRLNLKTGNNEAVKFAFSDVVGDTRKDYLAISEKELSIYSYQKNDFEKAGGHVFRMEQDGIFPVKIPRKKKSQIGTFSLPKKRIFLLDGKGNLNEKFPLEGTTPFVIEDLLGNGREVVVTGNGRRVCAYSVAF